MLLYNNIWPHTSATCSTITYDLPHVFLTYNKHPELTIYFPLHVSAGNCHLQVISLMYILKLTVQNKTFAQHLCIILASNPMHPPPPKKKIEHKPTQ
jgi:hypothetical protein